MKKKLLSILLCGAMCISLVACGSSTTNTSAKQNETNVEENSKGSESNVEEETAQADVTEEKEDIPTEYKNALKKAQMYSDSMNMSKAGLYDQLTSEYGEKFPAEAAQYAIDNVNADWNNNALKKAKEYQDMAMSKDAIYDQLTSDYGEKFTPDEAQYAVDNLE